MGVVYLVCCVAAASCSGPGLMLKEYIKETYTEYDTTPIQHKLDLLDTNTQHLEIYCRAKLRNTQLVNDLLVSHQQPPSEIIVNLETSVAREISDCAAAIRAFSQATDWLLIQVHEFMAERGMPLILVALQEALQRQTADLFTKLHAVAVEPRIAFLSKDISDSASKASFDAVRRTLAEVATEVPAWARQIAMVQSGAGEKRKRKPDFYNTGRVTSRIAETEEDFETP